MPIHFWFWLGFLKLVFVVVPESVEWNGLLAAIRVDDGEHSSLFVQLDFLLFKGFVAELGAEPSAHLVGVLGWVLVNYRDECHLRVLNELHQSSHHVR